MNARVDQVSAYVQELERENDLLKARVGNELDHVRFIHLLAILRDYLAHRGGIKFMDLHRFVKDNFK